MGKYIIDIEEEFDKMLQKYSSDKGVTVEAFILDVLSRYAVSPHIMEQEDVAKGYLEVGDINKDWSNL